MALQSLMTRYYCTAGAAAAAATTTTTTTTTTTKLCRVCFISPIRATRATRYGLDCPGIESRWRRDCRTLSGRPWGPHSLLYNGYRVSFPGIKRSERGAEHPPTSSAVVTSSGLNFTRNPIRHSRTSSE